MCKSNIPIQCSTIQFACLSGGERDTFTLLLVWIIRRSESKNSALKSRCKKTVLLCFWSTEFIFQPPHVGCGLTPLLSINIILDNSLFFYHVPKDEILWLPLLMMLFLKMFFSYSIIRYCFDWSRVWPYYSLHWKCVHIVYVHCFFLWQYYTTLMCQTWLKYCSSAFPRPLSVIRKLTWAETFISSSVMFCVEVSVFAL